MFLFTFGIIFVSYDNVSFKKFYILVDIELKNLSTEFLL